MKNSQHIPMVWHLLTIKFLILFIQISIVHPSTILLFCKLFMCLFKPVEIERHLIYWLLAYLDSNDALIFIYFIFLTDSHKALNNFFMKKIRIWYAALLRDAIFLKFLDYLRQFKTNQDLENEFKKWRVCHLNKPAVQK
jgi:hypothetical protein